jgi:hypothetical protein
MGVIGFPANTSTYWGALLASIFLVFWPWSAFMYRALYVKPIRRAMRENGFDLCIECGYDLRNLAQSSDKCPECGTQCEPMKS